MTAMITAAVVGVAGSAYVSNKTNKKADKRQAESLAFEQDRTDEWNDVYGPIQDNLADYYSALTPEYYETMGLEAFEQERQTAMTRLDESFAQRGIDPSSGIAASLRAQSELDSAEGRAEIRRDAPRMVAEDKSRFLQIGMGNDPSQSLANTLANRGTQAQQQADIAGRGTGKAVSNLIDVAGTALVDYVNTPETTTNTSTIGIE